MRRFLLIFVPLLIALFAVAVGAAWYLLQDEDFLKSRLSAFVLEHTGRELTVDGPLTLTLGRETTVEAAGIRFANAAWADEPDMAAVGRLRMVVDVPSLFGRTPVFPLLVLEDCSLSLVEQEDGRANWDLVPDSAGRTPPATSEKQEFPVRLLDAEMHNCRFSHSSPTRGQPLLVEIDELSQQLREDRHWQIQGAGRIGGEPVTMAGWLAPAAALVIGGPLEHELSIDLGAISLHSAGTIQDVATGQGANIHLRFHGPDIGRVYDFLGLASASSGPFDFSLSLDTQDQVTQLTVDGDLGQLQTHAEGELDRLVSPTQGRVHGTLEGADLDLLGRALGVDGLVHTAFALDADLGFEPGLVHFRRFELDMPEDRVSILGVLGTAGGWPGTDLDIDVHSEELGRWAGAWNRPVRSIGAITLTGRLLSDTNGRATIRARVEHPGSMLTVDGALGTLGEPLRPDLNVDFHSTDPRALASLLGDFTLPEAPMVIRGRFAKPADLIVLDGMDLSLGPHAATIDGQINPVAPFSGSDVKLEVRSPNAAELGQLFGRGGLPAAPLTLTGRVSRPGQRIRFEDVRLDLAGHRVRVGGMLNPSEKYAGSEFEVQLDTPDVADLAQLFGKAGLPHEAMALSGVLRPEGKGLQFKTEQGNLGDIRLAVEGHIPDLDQPLALDGSFDVGLPSLTLLSFLAPKATLPDLPFTAVGRLQRRQSRTQLQDVRLTLGTISGGVTGEIFPDQRFDLAIEIGGTDASALEQWVGRSLAPEPFSLRTRLSGNPKAFELADIGMQLGASRATGRLEIGLGARKTVKGNLASPVLDLSRWNTGEEAEPAGTPPETKSAYVFDDTPVMTTSDYGVDLDLQLSVARLELRNTVLHDVELGVLLSQNRLEITPFSLRGPLGGEFAGRAVLDNSGAKPVLDMVMDGEDLRLGLTAGPDQDPATFPSIELHLLLHGTGRTQRELASGLNGSLRAYGGPGQIASAGVNLLFSDFLSELFDALNPKSETSDYTRVDCSVIAADIVDGSVRLEPVILQTEEFTILSKGNVDLHSEKIDLSFNTKPRKGLGITPGTVINPLIKVGGTLKSPAIELDPAGAIVGGTAAVATAGLSIVAKSFSDRFLSSRDPCGDARKEIAKRDR